MKSLYGTKILKKLEINLIILPFATKTFIYHWFINDTYGSK